MGVFHAAWWAFRCAPCSAWAPSTRLVVYGKDGMDEVSQGAATLVGELKNGQISEYEIHPEDFPCPWPAAGRCVPSRPERSRAMLLGVLDNQPGAPRDIVILNAERRALRRQRGRLDTGRYSSGRRGNRIGRRQGAFAATRRFNTQTLAA